ncbi:MAG: hypothetical protein HY544_01740 [Candidatus Diapherotrites archaeon]|uniref:Glycosyl transferase family 28 C-terminal domain-containing protein n=1 Tax=Candidatus Iainarchaeum sp. TaxID=3101447 RepID=A0A8T3YPW5_9ARCH|nr:hypothetical protein [Candidatus Diapherotrites archaeon]
MARKQAGQGRGEKNASNTGGGKMIFVSVGTHPQQFDRLLEELDRLAGEGRLGNEVFAQTGFSGYKPRNFAWKDFLGMDEFVQKLRGADVFITHAGEGNIGLAKGMGKKFITMPRRAEFGEHTNNHQLELAAVVEQKGLGIVAWNQKGLEAGLAALENFAPTKVKRGNIPEILKKFMAGVPA